MNGYSLWRSRFAILAVLVLGVLTVSGVCTAAGPLEKLDNSLPLINDDVAFYATATHLREKFDAVAQSKAWKKLMELPVVQMGLSLYRMQAVSSDSVPGQIQKYLNDPQWESARQTLCDLVSQEVFMFGDETSVDFIRICQEVQGATRMNRALSKLSGPDADASTAQISAVLETLLENTDDLAVPCLVVGFKVRDTKRTAGELAKLEKVAREILDGQPKFKGRLRREKVGPHEFVTVSLDGGMLDLNNKEFQRLLKGAAEEPADAKEFTQRVKGLKAVLAVGLRDNYLLVSLGPSLEHIARLGRGKLLCRLPEFKPLEKYLERQIDSIAYASEDFVAMQQGSKSDISDLAETAKSWLNLAELDKKVRRRIEKDIDAFSKDIQALMPERGPMMGFSFRVNNCVENYEYSWGDAVKRYDARKPLGLLQHVGGSPLAMLVTRHKSSLDEYDVLVKWIPVAYGYFERFALPQIEGDERAKVEKMIAAARPFAKRLDEINRKMLFPALANAEGAFVLDNKLKVEKVVAAMPAAKKPLPMLEPAIVLATNDAKLLRKAAVAYWEAGEKFLADVRKIDPERTAEMHLPEPTVTKNKKLGEFAVFDWPESWGVNEKIQPTAALSDTVAVLTLSRDHAARLLQATAPEASVAPTPDRPVALAASINLAGLIDTLKPWFDYATDAVVENVPTLGENPARVKFVTDQVHTVLDVLKAFRTVTVEGYFDGDAFVQHSRLEIRDIE